MYNRLLKLPENPGSSLFLWGPRQTGKTTLLKKVYSRAHRIDLLRTETFMEYLRRPQTLREQVQALPGSLPVVIDEIQKVPALLNEVHYLIQEQGRIFIMCGSSARKVRKGHANLLGGRALRYELLGLSAREIGKGFSLERMLAAGPLPSHYDHPDIENALRSYVEDYLKEEILEEGLTRKLPVFSDFLRMAAIGDTEVINLTNIARECGIAVSTVRNHYEILTDTLLGAFVPAFTARPKRRTVHAPKFYFRDIGVVNHLLRRKNVLQGTELFGKAFENWVFHELSVHSKYAGGFYPISYWRLSSGNEVDFILGQGTVAIEVKAKKNITGHDVKGLFEFKKEYPGVKSLITVCLERQTRLMDDKVLVLPWEDFIRRLWDGEWNGSPE